MNTGRQLHVADGEVRGEQQPRRVNHYLKRAAQQTQPSYEPDEHELHPQPRREKLEVELADAAKANVKSETKQVASFTAGERPPLKFKGTVVVTAPEDEEVPEEAASAIEEQTDTAEPSSTTKQSASKPTAIAERHLNVKDTSQAKKEAKSTKKQPVKKSDNDRHVTVTSNEPAIKHVAPTDETGRRRTLLRRPGVVGMQRPSVLSTKATIAPTASALTEETPSSSHLLTGLSLAMFGVATLVTIGLLGAEIKVVSTVSGSELEYQFSIGQLVDNLMSLKEALFAQAGSSR